MFIAWYTEGRIYRGKVEDFDDLPEEGVLLIKTWSGKRTENGIPYTKVLSGDRFYFRLDDLIACDTERYLDDLLERYPDAQSIKRGNWTTDDEMSRVQEEASLIKEWDDG